jgi:hypothetical protein
MKRAALRKAKRIYARLLSRLVPRSIYADPELFDLWESRGFHLTPAHFYQPIPDTRRFPRDVFARETPMHGIDLHMDGQLAMLERFAAAYRQEYEAFPRKATRSARDFHFRNGNYETVDAEILHCMVRDLKPRRIVEIGSGYSTRISAAAIRANRAETPGYECELTCVEPYPGKALREGFDGLSRLIDKRVQDVPASLFAELGENDILFIDSTHIVTVANDCCHEYLEILPLLNKGVHVHVHDIVLPRIYCEHWYRAKVFWNEQYLLQAFLALNGCYEVVWASHLMHLRHPEALAAAFPSYSEFANDPDPARREHGHKSFWMRRAS